MIIKTFVEPPIDNNNYLIIDEQSGEAALVDCSFYDEDIYNAIKNSNATLKYILLTHGHFDHVSGIRPINGEFPKVLMNKKEVEWLKRANSILPDFGMPEITIPDVNIDAVDGLVLKLGEYDIKIIHTPGHTQGGVCYYIGDKLFSGDTLFCESIGRCDLDGGNFEQLIDSVKTKIFSLPNETIIYPGHGKSTNVEWEKMHNHFM